MKNLIIFFSFLVYLPNIKSDCLIKLSNETENVPKFEKRVGDIKISLPTRGGAISIRHEDSITGTCETHFSPIKYFGVEHNRFNQRSKNSQRTVNQFYTNHKIIYLDCLHGSLFYLNEKLHDQIFSCAAYNSSIYSTKQPYVWCRKNQGSSTLLVATENLKSKGQVLAALCYNIAQLSLQTLVYNKTNINSFSFNKPAATGVKSSNDIFDEKLWHFETIITSELSNEVLKNTLNRMAETEKWLHLANYEVSSILQDDLLMKYFKDYKGILNVIWWHPLRLGNWKEFQRTLTNYAQSNSFELYVGRSGVAPYPSESKYNKEKYLEIQVASQTETIPAYIWTYLKSNDQLNRDFVIVGYNSPYAEYLTKEKIIFCPDICKEIPWLKEISSTFHYAYAGIMFCCSTDFIRQTNYLEGFPLDILPTQHVATTVAKESLEDLTTEVHVDTTALY